MREDVKKVVCLVFILGVWFERIFLLQVKMSFPLVIIPLLWVF